VTAHTGVPGGLAVLKERLADRSPVRSDRTGRREAAVAIVLVPGPAGLELLFIKRCEHPEDPWSGQMAFPGGRREDGDPDLLATAIRETREETGLELYPGDLAGELDDLAPMTPVLPPIVVAPYVFGLKVRPGVTPSTEVALHLWVPLGDLPAARVREAITIRGLQLTVDGYRLGPHLVWGMTERILTPLLTLIGVL
jgi:8-oxo-dGTP pyrophosphatase MutT (NUDIX family)